MTAAWPLVRDQLVTVLPGLLTGVTVWDGKVVTQHKPAAFVTIGYQPSASEDSAGSYQQGPSAVGGFDAVENGTVLMEAGARTGSTETPDAFGIAQAIQDWVHANQTLSGVLSKDATASIGVQVVQAQKASGAVQRLLITLTYFTRV